jgi:hypothetical protein
MRKKTARAGALPGRIMRVFAENTGICNSEPPGASMHDRPKQTKLEVTDVTFQPA